MATRVAEHLLSTLGTLRYEPIVMRVRAVLDGRPAVDSTHAVLVWEPQRAVPQYAVPAEDVLAELVPAAADAGPRFGPGPVPLGPDGLTVLTPGTGFGVHTSEGEVLTVALDGHERPGAAFRLADPELAGYVSLDFTAFDTWLEEEAVVVSHPRDPFHRIDVRPSTRHVRIERDGVVLADSHRPALVSETILPLRYYLPREDVRMDLMRPSDTVTACAYKGVASYFSTEALPDVAWTYPRPLPDAHELTDLVCFFSERVDVVLDGVTQGRTTSPWS